MKLLMIYAERFSYKPNAGTLESAIDISQAGEANDVQVGLIQVEKDDEDEIRSKETKLVKNLKWAAKKNGTNKIVLIPLRIFPRARHPLPSPSFSLIIAKRGC